MTPTLRGHVFWTARSSHLAAAMAVLACVIVLPPWSSASAGKIGVAARAGSATLSGPAAQPPMVTFPDGTRVDLWALTSWVATRTIDDTTIVIHEPATGSTREASPDVASIEIISFEGGGATTLGELRDQPGALVLFESHSTAFADPYQVQRFEVAYAQGGSAISVARPVFGTQVPEPGLGHGIVAGLTMLIGMTRRERSRHGVRGYLTLKSSMKSLSGPA